MNRLLISAAIAALVIPTAACNRKAENDTATRTAETETTPADTTVYPTDTTAATTETTDAATTANAGATMVAHMMPGEISAKDLIGDEIFGPDGKAFSKVDDILINASERADKLIFQEGGAKRMVDFKSVKLEPSAIGDPAVRVSVTEDQAKTAATFEQKAADDYRLASELLGAEVDIAASTDNEAKIEDLILAKDGAVKDVIVQRSAMGVGAGDLYAFDFSKLSLAEGDAGLVLNVSDQELNEASKFEYSAEDAVEETSDND